MTQATQEEMGWFAGMVDGARKAFGLASGRTAEKPKRRPKAKKPKRSATSKIDYRARASLTRRLADEGFTIAQIAKRTGLSQDTVTMLLKLTPSEGPEESAGTGSFFRTLQTRLAG